MPRLVYMPSTLEPAKRKMAIVDEIDRIDYVDNKNDINESNKETILTNDKQIGANG